MDWFTDLGVYYRLFQTSPALAFDLATTPGLNSEQGGFDIGYYAQSMPEIINTYPMQQGPFGGA